MNDGSYFFASGRGREETLMCRAMAAQEMQEMQNMQGTDALYEGIKKYSFTDLCYTVCDMFKQPRHSVDRFTLNIGDSVNWFDGSGYIPCRVTGITNRGNVMVCGIQDKIRLTITNRNEDEFYL